MTKNLSIFELSKKIEEKINKEEVSEEISEDSLTASSVIIPIKSVEKNTFTSNNCYINITIIIIKIIMFIIVNSDIVSLILLRYIKNNYINLVIKFFMFHYLSDIFIKILCENIKNNNVNFQ